MNITLNKLITEIEALSRSHGMVNDFYYGDSLRAWKEEILNYPLVNCFIDSTGILEKQNNFEITLVVSDRIYQDWNYNLKEVHSDTLLILRHLIRVMRKSNRWRKMGRIDIEPNASSFVADTGDYCAGWSARINFLVKEDGDICDIPIFDYDYDDICNLT